MTSIVTGTNHPFTVNNMTPQQLTAPERIALLARMEEDERKLQEEW